jgi:PIN domain nuclease of toxin-antitoxin system
MNRSYLLDTCAVIWMTHNQTLAPEAVVALQDYRSGGLSISVSTATAWEMAMLLTKSRIRETRTAKSWYDEFRRDSGALELPVTADIFMASCSLPNLVHKDPIDRILIATARENDLTIITRDRAILSYGVAGHVRTLAC